MPYRVINIYYSVTCYTNHINSTRIQSIASMALMVFPDVCGEVVVVVTLVVAIDAGGVVVVMEKEYKGLRENLKCACVHVFVDMIIRKHYVWNGMKVQIQTCVKHCQKCQLGKSTGNLWVLRV